MPDTTRLSRAEAEIAKVTDEEAWLRGSPHIIGAQVRLVALCKRRNRLENLIADLRYAADFCNPPNSSTHAD